MSRIVFVNGKFVKEQERSFQSLIVDSYLVMGFTKWSQ